jgi:uroporphyrinogen decarboxylase
MGAGEPCDRVVAEATPEGFMAAFAEAVAAGGTVWLADPAWGAAEREQFAARLAEKILRQVDVDGAIFSEPIAGNHGPLISPEMYRRFALESYRAVFDALQARHVPAIIWRSYANPDRLLPEVMKHPFNAVWLCERPPGALTPAQVRELIGGQATLIGGIDGDVLRQDREAIRQAVAAARRLAAAGRFIPLADGRVRGDAPYAHF